MYLSSVQLYGFKSFPRKTTLKFEPGITVIVGPNGCGKSNILDAIKWALGEQSPKTLRGTRMEDVIFNGTQDEPPLNFAEVTLTFSNQEHLLGVDFEEVSITRRVFRSGESEYYLNKAQVRLKDIQDLLMPVGLGEGSYSFVAQGTVESMVTYRPEERRVIFDEASGILKFKEKKREVLRKLEDTENNLLRLEDIITEVKRQRDFLSRQVSKSRRYQELYARLKETEKKLALFKIIKIREEERNISQEISSLDNEEKKRTSELQEKKNTLESSNLRLKNLRQEAESLINHLAQINSKISNAHQNIEVNRERISEFRQRIKVLEDQHINYSQRQKQEEERIVAVNTDLEAIEKTFEETEQKISQDSSRIEKLRENIKEKKSLLKELRESLLEEEEEKVKIYNSLMDSKSELNSLSSRRKRLLEELSSSDSELKEFEEKFSQVLKKREGLTQELDTLKVLLSEKEALFKSKQESLDSLRENLQVQEKEAASLDAQLQFLKDLKLRYGEFPRSEEVIILLSSQFKSLPAVMIAKIEELAQFDSSQKVFKVKTEARLISQGIGELTRRLQDSQQRLKETVAKIEELQQQLNSELASKDGCLVQIQEKDKEVSRVKETENNYRENLQRLNEERNLVLFELKETEEELNRVAQRHKSLRETHQTKEDRLNQLNNEINSAQEFIRKAEEEIKNLEIYLARYMTQVESLKEEKKDKLKNLEIFKSNLDSLSAQIKEIEQEKEKLYEKIHSLEDEIKIFLTQKQEYKKNIEELSLKKEEFLEKEKEILDSQKVLFEESKNLEEELDKVKQALYNKKLQFQELQFKEKSVHSELKQAYEIEISPEEVSSFSPALSEEALSSEVEELKRKIKYLGNVNLAACDEYEELNQRFDFLTSQKQDLLNSKEALKKAILKINKTSREMFLETFNKVQEEFKKNFRFLFGGGRAELVILNQEDLLDSGIDIIVQPPGKKLQNVTLLSGGEKSLTAVALIFSIFKVKPSALCILDEIDAALDEANVDRFNHMLSEFVQHSQFIVITHNKKTISKADVMYGVTMEKSGISQIVSVRFSESSAQGVKSGK